MGLRIPQSSWLMMNPQQQFLLSNGVMPGGLPLPDGAEGPMIQPSMPSEEQQKALADLEAAQMQSFQNQQKGIDDLAQYAQGIQGQEVQTDLTPLAALTDAWTGSKFAQSYKAPESGTAKAAQVAALKQALNKERGALTDDEIALLKAKINALTTQSIFGQKQAGKAGEKTDKEIKDDEQAREAFRKEAKGPLGGNIKFTGALDKYLDTVEKYGDTESLSGAARDEIEGAYSDALVAYKEFKNLGALAEADLALAAYGIKPQTGVQGGVNKIFGGGKEGLRRASLSLIEQGKKDFDLDYNSLIGGYKGRDVSPVSSVYQKAYQDTHGKFLTKRKSTDSTSPSMKPGTVVVGKDGKARRFKGGENKKENWEIVETGAK